MKVHTALDEAHTALDNADPDTMKPNRIATGAAIAGTANPDTARFGTANLKELCVGPDEGRRTRAEQPRRRWATSLAACILLSPLVSQPFAHAQGRVAQDISPARYPDKAAHDAASPAPVSQSVSGELPSAHLNPEAATQSPGASRDAVIAQQFLVSAANPLAAQAGAEILSAGGSVVDAAIAAQLVLGLVEPQSSGLGGGGFALVHHAGADAVHAYDGRETAPASAMEARFVHQGKALAFWDAVDSGLSVGTPGLVSMLAAMHKDGGRLAWSALFQPAIGLAKEGFPVSPRLHALVSGSESLADSPSAAAYFFDREGRPWPVGHVLRNADYARVLQRLADEGSRAFYEGEFAQNMVSAVAAHPVPGDLSVADLAGYRTIRRDALCAEVSEYRYCGMPPPSSGGLAVIQMMALLQHTPLSTLRPGSAEAVHYFSEAGRLAYADRAYVADPAFERVPVYGLLDPEYVATRANSIRPERSMGKADPGVPAGLSDEMPNEAPALEQPATTHLVVADREGNVVSMTTSIEAAFGSKIFVNGYLLNNQLTDFSLQATEASGKPSLNRVEPGKRPRSSMSPTLVFKEGKPYIAIGSPGGSAIINYVAKTLVGVQLWGMDVQTAIELPNMGSRNFATEIEEGTPLESTVATLKAMGHELRVGSFPSGVHAVRWTERGLEGGADPRREGVAVGR